jgi:biopolymer transport protein ExbD
MNLSFVGMTSVTMLLLAAGCTTRQPDDRTAIVPPPPDPDLLIEISARGEISLDGRVYSLSEIAVPIADAAKGSSKDSDGFPTVTVVLQADPDMDCEYLWQVMHKCSNSYISPVTWKMGAASYGIELRGARPDQEPATDSVALTWVNKDGDAVIVPRDYKVDGSGQIVGWSAPSTEGLRRKIKLGQRRWDMPAELKAELMARAARGGRLSIELSIAPAMEFKHAFAVLQACREAGIADVSARIQKLDGDWWWK